MIEHLTVLPGQNLPADFQQNAFVLVLHSCYCDASIIGEQAKELHVARRSKQSTRRAIETVPEAKKRLNGHKLLETFDFFELEEIPLEAFIQIMVTVHVHDRHPEIEADELEKNWQLYVSKSEFETLKHFAQEILQMLCDQGQLHWRKDEHGVVYFSRT